MRQDLLRAQRDRGRLFRRQAERLVHAVRVQALRPSQDRRQRLHGDADDVVLRLLRRQSRAARLRVETHLQRARLLHVEAPRHDPGPDAARRAELRDLLEEIIVRVEEERDLAGDLLDRKRGGARGLEIGDAVREGEGDLLHRRRAGLADVVPADADRVPARQLVPAVGEQIRGDAQGGLRREDVGAARDVFLQDVVLHGPRQRLERNLLLSRDRHVQRQQDRCGGVDRHRGGDAVERQARQELLHVLDCVDGDAGPSDLALRHRMVGVVSHLGRQVEGDRQPRLPLAEEVAQAPIGPGGVAEAGVLPNGPEAAPVHGRLHAAGERGGAREPQVLRVGDLLDVDRRVEPLDRDPAVRLEPRAALRQTREGFAQRAFGPLLEQPGQGAVLAVAHEETLPQKRKDPR